MNRNLTSKEKYLKYKMKYLKLRKQLGGGDFDCAVCQETFDDMSNDCVKLNCNHRFCNGCITNLLTTAGGSDTCPLCRAKIMTIKFCNEAIPGNPSCLKFLESARANSNISTGARLTMAQGNNVEELAGIASLTGALAGAFDEMRVMARERLPAFERERDKLLNEYALLNRNRLTIESVKHNMPSLDTSQADSIVTEYNIRVTILEKDLDMIELEIEGMQSIIAGEDLFSEQSNIRLRKKEALLELLGNLKRDHAVIKIELGKIPQLRSVTRNPVKPIIPANLPSLASQPAQLRVLTPLRKGMFNTTTNVSVLRCDRSSKNPDCVALLGLLGKESVPSTQDAVNDAVAEVVAEVVAEEIMNEVEKDTNGDTTSDE